MNGRLVKKIHLFRKEENFFRHEYYYERKISGIMKEKKKERKTNRKKDKRNY